MAADERDDLGDAGKPRGQERAHRHQRARVGEPHPVADVAAVLGGQQDGAARHLEIAQQLAEHLLGGRALVVDGLGHARGQAVGELELGGGADRGLHGQVLDDPRLPDAVVDVDPAVQEEAVPGHLDVVEDHERVLLVEAGGQRPIERMGARGGGAVPAQEDQPGGVDGDREGQRIGVGARRDRQARVDGDLVGEGREGGEDAGPAHDDAVLGLAHLVEGDPVADDLWIGRLVHRGLDDGVGERDVLAGQPLLEADEILRPFRVGAVRARPDGAAGREAGELDVHVVRGAPHQPDGRLGDARQAPVPPLEVVDRPGEHVAHADRLARLGIGDQALVGIPMLAVEDAGQGAGGLRQRRVRR